MIYFTHMLCFALFGAIFAAGTSNDYLNATIVNGKNIIRSKEGQNVDLKDSVSRKDNVRTAWKISNRLQSSGKVIKKSDTDLLSENDINFKIINTTGNDSSLNELLVNLITNAKDINFAVLIANQPSVKIVKTINLMHIFYQVNSITSVQCNVYGYPLPSVEWAFSNCTDKVCEEENFTTISKKWHKQVVQNETFLISTLSIPVNESGKFRCKALESFEVVNFFVTDMPTNFNGMSIYGPRIAFSGADVQITCGASKIKYNADIDWAYRSLKNYESLITNNSRHMIISTWNSSYSYYSAITIHNVSNTFDGEYICSVIDHDGPKQTLKLSYPLMVKTLISSRINYRKTYNDAETNKINLILAS